MNADDFEQRLQRQKLRQVPPEWREEILSNVHHARFITRPVSAWDLILSTRNSQLSTLLWPSPKAWAALGALWLVLLVVNSSMTHKSTAVARSLPRPSPEMILAWREQERLLAELIGMQEM